MKSKTLELEYIKQEGLTLRELLEGMQSELKDCKTDEERECMLNCKVQIDGFDMIGAIVWQQVLGTIGQVNQDTYIISTNIFDVNHYDESVCPECNERKRYKTFQSCCDDCMEK